MSSQKSAADFEMKLEVVMMPVTDIDRAIAFYRDQVGFHLDHDVQPSETVRVVQLTPPGSGCSIVMGTGLGEISEMVPGSIRGLHLVVKDIAVAHNALIENGVAIGDILDMGGVLYAGFSDPDGNTWTFQQMLNRG